MVRVRFAPSPTGSLQLGNALTAVANRSFADERGGVMLLRIDDTDVARSSRESEAGILRDLGWLGLGFDEGPVRQSERAEAHREAAQRLAATGDASEEAGAIRFGRERRPTLLRPDGSATYHLASVVDDIELGVSHVIRGKDHLSNMPLHVELARALGAEPPVYVHHGLILGPDGHKLSKRHGGSSLSDLRGAGLPPEAVRAYLEELGLPRGDVHLDPTRLRRLAVEAIAALSDEELASRVGAPLEMAPALRGAHDLEEARSIAAALLEPPTVHVAEDERSSLERLRELLSAANGPYDAERAQALVHDLRAAGGSLRAVRVALTGSLKGPELWAVIAALPRDETLRRIDAAL